MNIYLTTGTGKHGHRPDTGTRKHGNGPGKDKKLTWPLVLAKPESGIEQTWHGQWPLLIA